LLKVAVESDDVFEELEKNPFDDTVSQQGNLLR
jgi:hypothetical protein